MYIDSYLKTADLILSSYAGKIPLASWLRDFFRQDKKYGSRDRKIIAHLCYGFFRLGNAFADFSIKDRVSVAQFLTAQKASLLLEAINPGWNERAASSIEEKLIYLNAPDQKIKIFPFADELSNEIDGDDFAASHLIQPDLFLRIRPGYDNVVKRKLEEQSISFYQPIANCVALDNGSRADQLFELDTEVVVQDISSQQVIQPLTQWLPDTNQSFTAWDCCAASGGKSILLKDHYPFSQLTVSDVRESILANLKIRFERAGIKEYERRVADVASPQFSMTQRFDVILCDAPCTGSGTWGRTPEQLRFFKPGQIAHYSSLQKKIAVNAAAQLKEGGYFLYITCSVFSKENEEVVSFIKEHTSLQLLQTQYYKGYHQKADTLFTALFRL